MTWPIPKTGGYLTASVGDGGSGWYQRSTLEEPFLIIVPVFPLMEAVHASLGQLAYQWGMTPLATLAEILSTLGHNDYGSETAFVIEKLLRAGRDAEQVMIHRCVDNVTDVRSEMMHYFQTLYPYAYRHLFVSKVLPDGIVVTIYPAMPGSHDHTHHSFG